MKEIYGITLTRVRITHPSGLASLNNLFTEENVGLLSGFSSQQALTIELILSLHFSPEREGRRGKCVEGSLILLMISKYSNDNVSGFF